MTDREHAHLAYQAFPNRKSELYLHGMHEAVVARGWSCLPHLHHRMLEVNMTLRGEQTFYTDAERFALRDGDMLFVPPMRRHRYEATGSETTHYFVIHLQVEDQAYMRLMQGMQPLRAEAGSPLQRKLAPVAEAMLERLREGGGSSIPVVALAFELISALERDELRAMPPPEEPSARRLADAIALDIERLLAKPDPGDEMFRDADAPHRNWLDRIAAGLGISRRHCCRIFRDVYRMTPKSYYSLLRQQEAMHLLANTDMTLAAIAGRVGFENAQSFVRQFAKWTGETPGRFRRRERGQIEYLTPLELRL